MIRPGPCRRRELHANYLKRDRDFVELQPRFVDGPEAHAVLQGGIEGLSTLNPERLRTLEKANPWLRNLLETSTSRNNSISAASSISSSSSNSSINVSPLPRRGKLVPGHVGGYYVVAESDSQEEGAGQPEQEQAEEKGGCRITAPVRDGQGGCRPRGQR